MKTTVLPRAGTLAAAADTIAALLEEKPDAVLAVSAGESCLALYDELAARCAAGRLDLSRARFFALTEYEGLSPDDPHSCRALLAGRLAAPCGIPVEHVRLLSAADADSYDAEIAAAGGLDMAVLDIGINGRFGFNEPVSSYDSRTHRQKLADRTREELAVAFGGEEAVPAYGLTAGVKTVVEARQILVISLGESTADAVFKMRYARTDGLVPAAFLQLPMYVHVYLDEQAASKL